MNTMVRQLTLIHLGTSSSRKETVVEKSSYESGATSDMKATGIVRRIDDLGRVVIPKEIRRTLRIREGDPLEIFVDRDGEVILKKYSPIGELGDFAKEYAESLYESTGHITIISDRDSFIAVAGGSKKEYLDKPIGNLLENCMENRKTVLESNSGTYEISKDNPETLSAFVAAPIIAGGDPIGSVVLLNKDESVNMGEMEVKMAETAAGFLGKQMEQ
ncbi:stage V sporulation protein T [Paenibacillus lactis]|uniref:Transcriptional regulator, AbrB family n=4 Tax=Paenibacillus TaxID=44249 RepID=G4HP18_9BACL|nr:transcriptional regulator, AbrB family [Paenibacillus lactis 154]